MTGSTTPALQLREITGYPGIVVEEVILGANIFKDIFGAIGDIVGGRAWQQLSGQRNIMPIRSLFNGANQCRTDLSNDLASKEYLLLHHPEVSSLGWY